MHTHFKRTYSNRLALATFIEVFIVFFLLSTFDLFVQAQHVEILISWPEEFRINKNLLMDYVCLSIACDHNK